MKVRSLATKFAVDIDCEATVVEAAKLMRNHHVGALVVTSAVGGATQPVGIVTDRDLVVGVMALDLDANILTVGDIMGQSLFTVDAGAEALTAIQKMRSLGIRRAPVVEEDGTLTGMFTLDDYVAHLAQALAEVSLLIYREQSEEQSHRVAHV